MLKVNNDINLFRAVLICLVVVVHIDHFEMSYPQIDAAILAFLMPTFLFITGYLANIHKSIKAFASYLLQIFLPYLFMMLGLTALHDATTGASFDLGHFLYRLAVSPIGLCWFLHTMVICALSYHVSFRLCVRLSDVAKYAVWGSLLIALATFTDIIVLHNVVYFFIGAGVRIFLGDLSKSYKPSPWPLLPFALLIIHSEYYDWSLLAVLAMVLCFLCVVSYVGAKIKGSAWRVIDYVGRNTLPIYMFHLLFTRVGKMIFPAFQFEPTGLLYVLSVLLLAVVGSLCIAKIMDYSRLSYLFGRKYLLR